MCVFFGVPQGTIFDTNAWFKHTYIHVYIHWRAIPQLKMLYHIYKLFETNEKKYAHYYTIFQCSMLPVSDFQESLEKCFTHIWAIFILKMGYQELQQCEIKTQTYSKRF